VDLGAIVLLIALFLGVGLYLAAPLLRNRVARGLEHNQEYSSMMAERDRVIRALQELDFDFKLGKIPQGDYPTLRADLLRKGTRILVKLDELSAVSTSRKDAPTVESRLERAAAGGPAKAVTMEETKAVSLTDEGIEAMLLERRKVHKSKPAGFCPRCGKPILLTDLFCPNCGNALD
jgi:zinc-ribbon domain